MTVVSITAPLGDDMLKKVAAHPTFLSMITVAITTAAVMILTTSRSIAVLVFASGALHAWTCHSRGGSLAQRILVPVGLAAGITASFLIAVRLGWLESL
jgi:hypothetical protein